jgi:predicted HTH domain antitoxin
METGETRVATQVLTGRREPPEEAMVRMSITFQLEDDLERQLRHDLGDLGQAAREALLIEAYRRGKLSIGRLAQSLGLGVIQADRWLAARGVALNYGPDDLRADQSTLRELLGPSTP